MASIPAKISQLIEGKYQRVNNTFSRAVKTNPKDKIEVQIGDAKQTDFKPQAKIMRWDNEVNFSLRAEEHPEATVETEGKLIKYITPNYEVHQYDLDPGEMGEDGGLEFEWVLPRKPETNVLTATIQTKELNFCYQPALTQKEIDNGDLRPENVVGSYAVYHKTKGGMNAESPWKHRVNYLTYAIKVRKELDKNPDYLEALENDFGWDAPTYARGKTLSQLESEMVIAQSNLDQDDASGKYKEYKTGKAFHIYRPKATDAEGKETWCDLHIDEEAGLLTVTIDQKWLDNAVYPVVVDPTFGYTSLGGSSQSFGRRGIIAQWQEAPENGDVTSLSVGAVSSSENIDIHGAILEYDADGDGGGLLKKSVSATANNTSQFHAMNLVSNQAVVSGTKYYLVGKGDFGPQNVSSTASCRYDSTGASGESFRVSPVSFYGVSAGGDVSWTNSWNVNTAIVELWGGGGAGGGRTSNGGGGGGGGGAYARSTVAVTPSSSYSIHVGNSVTGTTGTGSNGDPSTWETNVVVAAGGTGGSGGSGTSGGAGGSTGASTGDVKVAGGQGGNGGGSGTAGGGGGEAGGSNEVTGDAGDNASGSTGGPGGSGSGDGGDGGSGRSSSQGAGSQGSSTGGGGGGAYRTSSNQNGGTGRFGSARVTPSGYEYGEFPSEVINETNTTDTRDYSIYATYTASGGIETAAVSPLALTATIPAVTATHAEVRTASVSPLALAVTIPAVTATYSQVNTAAVAPLALTATIPAVTATYAGVYSAGVAPLALTASTTSTTATYEAVLNASVTPLSLSVTIPPVTATYIQVESASASPLALTATIPDVTATHSSVSTASVSPLSLAVTLPQVTATYIQVETATVEPLALTLTPTDTTATYVQVETATVSPLVLNVTIPEITATREEIYEALVNPVQLVVSLPSVTGSYVGPNIQTATVEPLAIKATIPEVTALYPQPPMTFIFVDGVMHKQITGKHYMKL